METRVIARFSVFLRGRAVVDGRPVKVLKVGKMPIAAPYCADPARAVKRTG